MYYVDDMTFREVSQALRLSESRICQLHTDIIRSLQGRYTFDRLRDLIGEAA